MGRMRALLGSVWYGARSERPRDAAGELWLGARDRRNRLLAKGHRGPAHD